MTIILMGVVAVWPANYHIPVSSTSVPVFELFLEMTLSKDVSILKMGNNRLEDDWEHIPQWCLFLILVKGW